MTKVIVVDENDKVIGSKERNDRSQKDIIRVSGLLVYNSENAILIARRSLNKVNDPGKWGPAVAGTVEEGETYISNIVKEAQEEIGLIVNVQGLKIERHSYQETNHKYFSTLFSVVVDRSIPDFVIQKEEVEEIRWIPIQELVKWFDAVPSDFIPSFSKTIDLLRS